MASIWAELKRRNVVKVAAAYLVVSWLVLQLTDVLAPLLGLPEWAGRLVLLLLLLGLPLAIFFAWAYELTPEGLKRDRDPERSAPGTHRAGKKLDLLVMAVLAIAVLYFLADKFFWTGNERAPEQYATEQSVAVLPFVNMSSDPEQDYFSDGISEEILNQLTKINGLQVAGRTSSFAFKGQNEDLRVIGENLNVSNILEGSVRKSGNRVRITAQLIKADDGYHLWSETYDRELTDIFTIQEEISEAVATALSIALGVSDSNISLGGTKNFDAYDAYLTGLSLSRQNTPDETVQAIEYLERAVSLDPAYAQAWSVLAGTYRIAANFYIAQKTEELSRKSEIAAKRAVEVAPEAVAALVALAQVQVSNRQWMQAEQSFRKALALAPADHEANLYYGALLLGVGRAKDATERFQRAASAEPLLFNPVTFIGMSHEINGEFDLALEEYRRGEDLIGNQAFGQLFIAVVGMETGNRELLVDAVNAANTLAGASNNITRLNNAMLSLLDRPDAVKAGLRRVSDEMAPELPVNRLGIAVWASYFHEPEYALDSYREVLRTQPWQAYIIWRPIEKDMRRLPEFKDLARDLGLLDYWRATGDWGDFCRPVANDDFECR